MKIHVEKTTLILDVNERINQKRPDNINLFVDRVHLSNTEQTWYII